MIRLTLIRSLGKPKRREHIEVLGKFTRKIKPKYWYSDEEEERLICKDLITNLIFTMLVGNVRFYRGEINLTDVKIYTEQTRDIYKEDTI